MREMQPFCFVDGDRSGLNRFWALALVVVLAPIMDASADQPSNTTAMRQRIEAAAQYLASDEMKGRSVDGPEINLAANYIRDQFQQIGLDVTQYGGTGFQPVEINLGAQAGPKEKNYASFVVGEGKAEFKAELGDGMNPLSLGAQSGVTTGRVIFAGYGITAPRLGYDDYAGVDAKGATVIVIRKEPRSSDGNSKFNGKANTRHAFFATKVENAIQHGAAAIIMVNDPASTNEALVRQQRRVKQERDRQEQIKQQLQTLPAEAKNVRKSLLEKMQRSEEMVQSMATVVADAKRGVLGVQEAGAPTRRQRVVPVLSVARDTISQVLKSATGSPLAEFESAIDENETPQSAVLANATGSISVDLSPSRVSSNNVIGILPGRGALAGETVVVGAHYDHVGMGGVGSLAPGTIAVHNGADDNASGTITMIETARALAARLKDVPSRRRLVFIAFTGEERGLLGSKYYVDHPLFPVEDTVAMLNLDMVGRLRDNELTVYGTGTAEGFDAMVDKANQLPGMDFKLFKVETGFGPSDHQSFYTAGIPVLFLFTGLHDDYHRPSDDPDLLNYSGMVRIAQMVIEMGQQVATQEERPRYVKTGRTPGIRRQRTTYIGATLGQDGENVFLSSITEGGPAAVAGLKVGDRIRQLGKKQVGTADEILEYLRTQAAGQILEVSLIRNGKPLKINVTLGKRPVQP